MKQNPLTQDSGRGSKSAKDDTRDEIERTFSKTQMKWIRDEILQNMVTMKKQLDLELTSDLEKLRVAITKDVTNNVLREVRESVSAKIETATVAAVDAAMDEFNQTVDRKIGESNRQIVAVNNNQLAQIAAVKQTTKELMLAVGQKVSETVYNQVIGEINSKIVPQVDSLVKFVHYSLQDGGEVVTDYRRAVEAQSNVSNQLLLTNGGDTKHIISAHVRTFFTADD
jgi:uncharacterized FlaG/YvyC family protein